MVWGLSLMQYIGNVPNIEYCKIRWWSLDELLLKLLFHSQHSLCGLMPFITSMQHWIKWYELAHNFILLPMTLPDCAREEKSSPAQKATVKQLCAGSGPCGKGGYRASSFSCLAWPHPQSPGESTFQLSQHTVHTPTASEAMLLLYAHSRGVLRYSEEELKMKSSSMSKQSKAGLVRSKCTNPGDGSCAVLMNV